MAMNEEINKGDLAHAAEKVQEYMQYDPPIKNDEPEKKLHKKLATAAKDLENTEDDRYMWDHCFDDLTRDVLRKLGAKPPWEEQEETDQTEAGTGEVSSDSEPEPLTKEEDTNMSNDELITKIQNTKKLKELKEIANQHEEFASLQNSLDGYTGLQGPKLLRTDMLRALGVDVDSEPAQAKPVSTGGGGQKKDTGPSNKSLVYDAWAKGETDTEKLCGVVNNAVKQSTVKLWVNQWKNGNNLPASAKKSE